MTRRGLTLASVAAATAVVLAAAAPPAGSGDRCTRPDTSPHWDGVFGHVTSLSQATLLKRQAAKVGFRGIIFERDWCDDVQVGVPGIDTPQMRADFAKQAQSVGFEVSFEPPETAKKPRPGIFKAVFGTLPTLKRADSLRWRMAHNGFREGTDIERLGLRKWRVLVHGIPTASRASFKKEAASVGYRVTFVAR